MKRDDVLEFYKKLQFNETSTPEMSAELIKKIMAFRMFIPIYQTLYMLTGYWK